MPEDHNKTGETAQYNYGRQFLWIWYSSAGKYLKWMITAFLSLCLFKIMFFVSIVHSVSDSCYYDNSETCRGSTRNENVKDCCVLFSISYWLLAIKLPMLRIVFWNSANVLPHTACKFANEYDVWHCRSERGWMTMVISIRQIGAWPGKWWDTSHLGAETFCTNTGSHLGSMHNADQDLTRDMNAFTIWK